MPSGDTDQKCRRRCALGARRGCLLVDGSTDRQDDSDDPHPAPHRHRGTGRSGLCTGCSEDKPESRDAPTVTATVTATATATKTPAAAPTKPAATRTAPVATAIPDDATVAPPGTMLAAVYYVFDHGELGPRLVREFRRVPKSTGVVRAAVDAMLHLEPLDPDYTSFWPRTAKIRGIRINGDTATVDLSAEARLRIDRAVEIASMQQLVWTVTAAAPKVTKVKVLVAGRTPPSSQSDWSGPQRRAKRSDTVARVQISSPQHGATVSRKTHHRR